MLTNESVGISFVHLSRAPISGGLTAMKEQSSSGHCESMKDASLAAAFEQSQST